MGNGESLVEDKVICPHCWHGFYSDEGFFISRHPDLFGDSVLGEMENRRFAPHEAQAGRNGEILDSKGWKMTERACPLCHLQIPPTVLARRPFFLSIVGAPRSGKTYFLTSMVHGLRKELAKSFGLSLHDSDSHEVRAFMEYEKTLFGAADPTRPTLLQKTQEQGSLYNTVQLDGADVQLPKPFIFSLKATESNPLAHKIGAVMERNLVLYDNAGESFEFLKEKAGHIRVTQHLAQCDAVLFTFDPLQVSDARSRLAACSQDPQVSRLATSYQQEKILQETIHRMRRHRGLTSSEMLTPRLIVCVQKFDVWKSLLPHVQFEASDGTRHNLIDHSSVEYSEKFGVAGLDVEEINRISLVVRAFMEDLCPEFVALAEANSRTVRYFPVSALGTSPEIDDAEKSSVLNANMLKVRPIKMQPFRVTHPMLWLLQKWGFIARTTSKRNRADRYANATVTRTSNGHIRVQLPQSKRAYVLDDDYAGSMIVDPYSGQAIWIPEIAPDVSKPALATPSDRSPPPRPQKLSINKPNQPPRRGWFKK